MNEQKCISLSDEAIIYGGTRGLFPRAPNQLPKQMQKKRKNKEGRLRRYGKYRPHEKKKYVIRHTHVHRHAIDGLFNVHVIHRVRSPAMILACIL